VCQAHVRRASLKLSQLRHAEAAYLIFKLAHNDDLTSIKRRKPE